MRTGWIKTGSGVALVAMVLAACGQDTPAFSPPLLMDTAGLSAQFPLAQQALGPDGQARIEFPTGSRFQGHVLGLAEGAVVAPVLIPDRAAGLALYGPRRPDGLFGLALDFDSTGGGGRASLPPRPLVAGDYLLLVADSSGRGGAYRLQAACQDNCGQPACEPLVWGNLLRHRPDPRRPGLPRKGLQPGLCLRRGLPARILMSRRRRVHPAGQLQL